MVLILKKLILIVFNDDTHSTIQLIFESDKNFVSPKIFLHSPFGLPVIKNSLNYSNDSKKITANFKFDKDLISKNNFPLEVSISDVNHNFKQVLNVEVNDKPLRSKINQLLFIIY